MKIIDELRVRRVRGGDPEAVIQLLNGDLANIPPEHSVDALVVSAFPDRYDPVPGTLFQSLDSRGLDIREVAAGKLEDERSRLGCWLSRPLPAKVARKFRFKQVICFEPLYPAFVRNSGMQQESIEQTVGFVFRCLNNFVIPDVSKARHFHISRVAMPLLATGNQGVRVEAMLPRLLAAAVFWLEGGLPVEQLKIVAYHPEQALVARKIFAAEKSRLARRAKRKTTMVAPAPEPRPEPSQASILSTELVRVCSSQLRQELLAASSTAEKVILQRLFDRVDRSVREHADVGPVPADGEAGQYDVFVSYAHKQDREVRQFVRALRQAFPKTRVFYDRTSISAGAQWIRRISDAVWKARIFVAVLSPDYSASPVCWDEFQCAKLKEYNTRQTVIRTVRLYSERSLPPIMGIYSYIDCAEGDIQKFRKSVTRVLGGGAQH